MQTIDSRPEVMIAKLCTFLLKYQALTLSEVKEVLGPFAPSDETLIEEAVRSGGWTPNEAKDHLEQYHRHGEHLTRIVPHL